MNRSNHTKKQEIYFSLYWLNGSHEVIFGFNKRDAFNNAGYSQKQWENDIDFIDEGITRKQYDFIFGEYINQYYWHTKKYAL